MSESVTREIVLPLEREEAWRVVTEPDHLREWLADDVEIDLVEGGLIDVGWDGGGRRLGTVETVEELERLVFRWHPEDPGPDHIETTVEIGLDDDVEGTRVTVVETGFEALEPTSLAGCTAVSTWIWDVRLGACGELPLMLAR
jgi:uncharacterized protein YndB with AHSA1/START domain